MKTGDLKRRHVLQLLGISAVGATVPATRVRGTEGDWTCAIQQGEQCVQIEPLWGDEPVEDIYDYAYPVGEFDGALGSDGTSYSSEGTAHLQRDNASVVFPEKRKKDKKQKEYEKVEEEETDD